MSSKVDLIVSSLGEERVKLNENLLYHTYIKKTSEAESLYIATNTRELEEALNTVFELKFPFTLLGAGTKILLSKKKIRGLVIKNRTSQIKINGIKGKVGKEGLGVAEALIEADSGVSIGKLNEYLDEQKLRNVVTFNSVHATVGGSLVVDQSLQNFVQKIKVWEEGETLEIDPIDLKRDQIILSVVFKVKAA